MKGILLLHDEHDNVQVLRDGDLLIKDNVIAKIGKDIQPNEDTEVIDCRGKIVSPGFVDAHHHVWQTQLKGRHSDDSLLDYHPKGNLQYFNYTAQDVFWGELGGLMEAIDGGTTMVVDHAHMSLTPDRTLAGLSATLTSGIRSIFCPSLGPQIQRWDKDGYELNASKPVPDFFMPQVKSLCQEVAKEPSGKVAIGLGFDAWYVGKEKTISVFKEARGAGCKFITSHWRRNNVAGSGGHSVPETLKDYGLLGPDIILSHGTGSTDEEFKMLKDSGSVVCMTPATESQMAHGEVAGFRKDVFGCFGADCHSNNHASILHAMQVGLAVARSHRNSHIMSQGRFPKLIEPTTQQAFNLATIAGARALRMDGQIGSLKEGKQADIVIFSTESPSMTCVVDHDPVAAVVRHASNAEIEHVLVGGKFLKRDGKLCDVGVEGVDGWGSGLEETTLDWKTVAGELRKSRGEIQARINTCNVNAARRKVMEGWGFTGGDEVFL
ncbi:hypothetical protein PRZ48_012106 [Zasmidium cellare]|uniref:Amidohydrolase-related domain-containing protein n=1 Tax=Zasmidium cellare TaxID=395010 RepID=A0ABR0E3X7_ZASCE|nr:hypothetical protein PRZ48_012106 [Zasmidium cellare]